MRWKQGCRYEKERLCWPQDHCPKRHGTTSSQEMPASPKVPTEPSAVPEAEHRSVEGARSGCWSPAVSLRPQTPLESTAGHWEPEEKGAAYQTLRCQLRQLVHHTVWVVQDRNAAERREGVTLLAWIISHAGLWGNVVPQLGLPAPKLWPGREKASRTPFPIPSSTTCSWQ